MRLSGLTLRHFRNLGSQDLEFPPEGVALIGDNAQGKSNLLEAIYYLETLRSFRGATEEQMLAFGADVFRVAAKLDDSGGDGASAGAVREVAVGFEKRRKRKKVTVDGAETPRMSDALGHLGAVIFSPADVELVSGGPSERRRFLDVVLSLADARYLEALQEYRRVLARRNASLKDGQPESVFSAWDPGLVDAGSRVMEVRSRWIAGHDEAFGGYYRRVSDERAAHLVYRPSVALEGARSREEMAQAFRTALARSRERERRLGTTVVGPHRDELLIVLDDEERAALDLRAFGSGGQRRTAALALRLVEARTVRETRTRRPLLLLDDVFAELDEGRSERVLALMEGEEAGQVILTAPKESDVRLRRDTLPRWRIASGRVSS